MELVQGNDAVIASAAERYTRSVLERADTLKHIARWGVGFETIDVSAATDLGVLVTTTQGSNHGPSRISPLASCWQSLAASSSSIDAPALAPGPDHSDATCGGKHSGSLAWVASARASRNVRPVSR